MRTLAFFLERQLALLVIILVLSTTPIFTTLKRILALGSPHNIAFVTSRLEPLPRRRRDKMRTNLPLVLRHIGSKPWLETNLDSVYILCSLL